MIAKIIKRLHKNAFYNFFKEIYIISNCAKRIYILKCGFVKSSARETYLTGFRKAADCSVW